MKSLWIIILIILFSSFNIAQISYDCTVEQSINGSNLEVSVYIQSSGDPFVIGGANFRMNVNTVGLNISSLPSEITEGLWDDGNDPSNYNDQAPGRNTLDGWVSIDIFGKATGNGVTVPSIITLVGTISIPISNTGENSELTWRTSGQSVTEIIDNELNNVTSLGDFTINQPVFPLPVELSSFTAIAKHNIVNLKWETKTEINNFGFEVERLQDSKISKLQDSEWEKIGFVQGNGNSNSPKDYAFTDKNPAGGSKFIYRLKQIDNDGKFEYSDQVEVELLPDKFELYQNYPNPFNPVTNIKFSLPSESKVVLKIYNILGAEVMELLNEKREAGIYEVEFNGANLSSGTYIYRLETPGFVQTKKMILMK